MEADTYVQIQQAIKRLLAVDLTHYKDQQMQRRLETWLARSEMANWNEYLARLSVDNQERARFRNYLTINVSSFFRDPERWRALREGVLPKLIQDSFDARAGGGLRLWSAGCSIGAEAFTMTIILAEQARGRMYYLLASDLDRGALTKARAGGPFGAEEIKQVTEQQRAAYFNLGGPPYFVRPSLVQKVTFREQNLLSDPFETGFDLIVCRNVLIYFNQETKNMLFEKFQKALRPGGILFLGGAEIIPFPQQFGLRSFGISFYEKV